MEATTYVEFYIVACNGSCFVVNRTLKQAHLKDVWETSTPQNLTTLEFIMIYNVEGPHNIVCDNP
jgi:hypothetical protein